MKAQHIVTESLKAIANTMKIEKAIGIAHNYGTEYLPINDENNYLGIIDLKQLEGLDMEKSIKECDLEFNAVHVYQQQHIFEIIDLMSQQKKEIVSVLDDNEDFLGFIYSKDIIEKLGKTSAFMGQGAIIVLKINEHDYALSQISQIVESNDAKIMFLYTEHVEDSALLRVHLMVTTPEIQSMIQNFERYNFSVEASYLPDNGIQTNFSDRYDSLMKYLDV